MKSILYVEDELEAREMVGEVLLQQYPEFTVRVAADGAEGLALFQELRPQLVITDITMPRMDGLTMASRITEMDAEVDIIALTAYSDTVFLVRAIELGFTQYVFKPINLKKLLAAVDKTLSVIDLKQQVKEQNDRLRQNEQQLQATFDQAAVGIAHVALDGTFLRVNRRYCDIVGCCDTEEPDTIYDFTHPDDLASCEEHHKLVVEGKIRSYTLEKRYLHPGGSVVWASLTVSLVVGDAAFMVVIIDDITARKEMETEIVQLNADLAARAAELENANRDLKAFNYTVAHDLRQPLNVINGYCQAIKEFCGEKLTEECREFLQMAYEGTLKMNRLVSALLQFAQTADVQIKQETVNLTATAEDVAEELKRAEPQRKVTFRIASGLTAEGDSQLLRVVLANLFGNAWKYSVDRDEGVIELGTMTMGGTPAFFVRDNGMGFSNEEAKEIFLPFRRLPGGQRSGGFGVGLATVERIIKRHGGKIWAEGETGKGATFYFTLGGGS